MVRPVGSCIPHTQWGSSLLLLLFYSIKDDTLWWKPLPPPFSPTLQISNKSSRALCQAVARHGADWIHQAQHISAEASPPPPPPILQYLPSYGSTGRGGAGWIEGPLGLAKHQPQGVHEACGSLVVQLPSAPVRHEEQELALAFVAPKADDVRARAPILYADALRDNHSNEQKWPGKACFADSAMDSCLRAFMCRRPKGRRMCRGLRGRGGGAPGSFSINVEVCNLYASQPQISPCSSW